MNTLEKQKILDEFREAAREYIRPTNNFPSGLKQRESNEIYLHAMQILKQVLNDEKLK